MDTLSPARTDAYLRRIGADRPDRPTEAALRDLQLRHLMVVPFENLSIHLGEDVVLAEEALVAKIVDGRRGGFCYELNGAFAALLRTLGYEVELLQARVFGEDGRPGIPYDHLALRVRAADGDGRAWLADVGFGDHSHFPLRLDDPGDQRDPAGVFRLVPSAEPDAAGDLDVVRDGTPRYRLEQRPRVLRDFAAGAWWHRTSPESPFTRAPLCSLPTGRGRVTLSGRRLVTTDGGAREEHELEGDGELLAAYREHFGVRLDRVPVPLHPRP
ncbi:MULTISPECIES: arylamine N-acetyltransferase family protein [Streptomyces]|uniref:Acetyltransferase n=2 Tax=Streptomyces TaxID=1883 RepID=A0A117IUP0_9ACTN|nr:MULTISPECIES: arylamine N-acetyltransferase [Streptomyces]KUH35722.1 acetyltransferase [Streptomyces kanasensis]UUS30947.1 arylamine N-acetyltransferase [Streptomyces changanensis]